MPDCPVRVFPFSGRSTLIFSDSVRRWDQGLRPMACEWQAWDPQAGLDCQDRCRRASLAERFAALHDRPASFDERFASANPVSSDERFGSIMRVRTASLRLPPGQEVQKQRADAPPAGTRRPPRLRNRASR